MRQSKVFGAKRGKKETFDLASSTSASVFLTSFLVTSRRSSLRASVRTNGSLYFPAESPVEKGPLSPQSLPESFPLVLLGFMETTTAASLTSLSVSCSKEWQQLHSFRVDALNISFFFVFAPKMLSQGDFEQFSLISGF